LLNQFTANAVQIPVFAGPAEATACGNILVQAIAMGHIDSLAAAREIVRTSHTLRRFDPQHCGPWNTTFARFEQLI
jgi:sugar (pentulose or hexulose) kinase